VRPGTGKRYLLLAICLGCALLFSGLGVWQLQRLSWKRDLIARVEARIHAPPAALPARAVWASLDVREAEYRRVHMRGMFLHERETLVDALTVHGPGAWVLTPLRTADGIVLVNRGFVPRAMENTAARKEWQRSGEVVITGLLRAAEPDGRILRPNNAATGRWFSRDVAAIAAARGLHDVAPFFIDADLASSEGPIRGGLTVVRFRNAHLGYALTWFALAALCVAGLFQLRGHRHAPVLAGS
jgi:surfeit locus 1 family protein